MEVPSILTGYATSVLGGWVVCEIMARTMKYAFDAQDAEPPSYLPQIVGVIERVMFTTFYIFSPAEMRAAIVPAMMGWLALKLAANWNHTTRRESTSNDALTIRRRAMIALLVGLVSCGIAFAGGVIGFLDYPAQ